MHTDNKNCRPWQATVRRTAFSLLAASLLAAGMAQAAMYRWVDGNGRVHYSDTPPTTYQKSGGAELNKQGLVIKRTQSEAERQAEAERLAEQKRIQAERDKQAQIDRALTQTYTTEAEIDLARDRALEHHKLAIKGAQIRGEAVDKNLADLRARIARVEKAGRKVGQGLQDQLAQANKESQDLKRIIQNNEAAMETVREKYAADKARFRELTGKP
ncbi:MAG: DUF4124 domain-containing protein [Gammaproteobacteria bacterium]|nr:DUF4124 domain-containing protein [Gammaproteobacteria bacterium]MBU1409197.1 DUF4124 domain-containing protein [Gammaproteobacteria bacterium]MBU1531093.1 DUF4124 domain-containing protein [Gammaproteobacteria bacterium]